MNAGIQASGLRKRWYLVGITTSNNAAWAFDRWRLYYPKWFTYVGLFSYADFYGSEYVFDESRNLQTCWKQEPTYGKQLFASDLGFEHTFTFDLSFNTTNANIYIAIYGIPPAAEFQQIYADPTGYSATRGKFSQITEWDFSVVNTGEYVGNSHTSIIFRDNPLEILRWNNHSITPQLKAKTLLFNNCRLNGAMKARLLEWADAGGVLGGTLDYSGSFFAEQPLEGAWPHYNNLIDKGWAITGEKPAGVNPEAALLLDMYPTAKYAFSYRLLRSDYAGPCIRVRRSSDNVEQDIGFINNYLDKTALLDFIGTGDGYLVKKYDQSVNGKDWFETAAAYQGKIVSAGVINEAANLVATHSGQSRNDNLLFDSTSYLGTTVYDYIVGLMPSGAGDFILATGQTNSEYNMVGASGMTTTTLSGNAGTPTLNINGVDKAPATRDDVHKLVATNSKLLITLKNSNYSTWTKLQLNYVGSTLYSGLRHTFERVGYPDGADMAAIQAEINAYYTIY